MRNTATKLQAILSLLDMSNSESESAQDPVGQHIVVLDRGFVYVGDCSWSGDWLTISNSRNIRTWGTTKGLGQLRNGPLPDTKLDDCGTVLVMRDGVKHLIPCKGF